MTRLFWIILVASFLNLSYTSEGNAAPLIGQDYLALSQANFDVGKATKYLPRHVPLGVLDRTFSPDDSKVSSFLHSVSPSYVRIHIFNGSCIRNRNCGNYEPTYRLSVSDFESRVRGRDSKLLTYLTSRVAFYKELAAQNPSTTFLISPVLEHDLTVEAWRILADTVLATWSDVQLVNSPDGYGRAEKYKGAWIERHGNTLPPDSELVSLDGTDGTDIDINKLLLGASALPNLKILYMWTRGYNCRTTGAFLDPRKRTACPSASTFELMAHLADDRGPAPRGVPAGCRNVVAFRAPLIWKLLAENNGSNDVRADKPVAILKAKGKVLNVLSASGRAVGALSYYGTYTSGMYRYYSRYPGGSGIGGYGFEQRAKESARTPYAYLRADRQTSCYGPFIPGRRQGLMR